ncbi:pre-mRNA-splicing factor prp12, partial [Olea europaea subsp. europaea]
MAVSEEESSSSSKPGVVNHGNNKSQSSSNSNSAACYLAKTVLTSSVVLQVVRGHFRSSSSSDVIFGKETSIEMVIIDNDGIVQSISEQPVFGIIKDLAVLPWNKRFQAQSPKLLGKDILVVLSDSGKLSFLSFCNEMHRFFPLTHFQLSSPGNSRYQLGRMLAVDSSGCYVAASAYEDRRGSFYRNELLLLEWNIVKQAVHVIYQFAEAGPLAHHIVEVPNSHGCAFLFRAGDALLMDFRDVRNPCCVYKTSLNFTPPLAEELSFVEDTIGIPDIMDEEGIYSVAASALLELSDMNKNDDPMNIDDYSTKPGSNYVCSWSWEPGNLTNPRMIFSADTGELYMIQVFLGSDDLRVNLSDCLYKGPPSKALLWVEGGFLAAVVDMADGMVLKLEDGLLQYRSPIQSVAPILDISVVDHPDENHDQIFACSGMAPEGTLRVIRNGISVEKLLKTSPIYHCVTGTWTVKMKVSDPYHSFLVLSFVEETRVLSVGLSFTDVTDSVGFQPDVCTLACGLVADGVMIQIHQCGIRLCVPVRAVHPEGVPLSSPVCTSWFPDNMTLSLGAVGCNLIVVATSSPYLLFVLGVRSLSACHYEIYQMQCIRLQNELSCISIPQKCLKHSLMNYADNKPVAVPTEINIDNIFVIGTHKPSVEVISFVPDKGLKVLATGIISLTNTVGTAISGCIPQDVRLVLVDRLYVLSGLRNGMLLRFEWPVESAVSSTKLPSHQNFVDSCL